MEVGYIPEVVGLEAENADLEEARPIVAVVVAETALEIVQVVAMVLLPILDHLEAVAEDSQTAVVGDPEVDSNQT